MISESFNIPRRKFTSSFSVTSDDRRPRKKLEQRRRAAAAAAAAAAATAAAAAADDSLISQHFSASDTLVHAPTYTCNRHFREKG
jgi:hypothetical protein